MNTSEIFNPEQRKQRVVEGFLNSHYGLKLAAHGDAVKVQTMISKLMTENHNIASATRNYQNSEKYVKNTMIIEALRHILQEIAPARTKRKVNEAEDLEQAELILVAKAMVDKLQDMAEDVAQMQTDELMPLEEKMKTTFGQEQGQSFGQAADQSLATLLDAVKAAKDALSNAVAIISGDVPIGGELATTEIEPSISDDEFTATDAASGEEELPLGREMK